MVQLIIGEKGKGKTKILLEKADNAIRTANGNVVYLDKSKQHMYELNNRIRLIDVTNFPLVNADSFVGFLCGLISRDNDLEQVFLDSFLKIARVSETELGGVLEQIDNLSKTYGVDFVISISVTREQIPDKFTGMIINE